MRTAIRFISAFFLFFLLVVVGGRQAEAVPVSLNDLSAGPNEYSTSILADPGYSYRFSFSYWIGTDFIDNPTVAQNHDTFYYALFTAPDLTTIPNILFENTLVDISSPIPETDPVRIVTTFAPSVLDQYLFPYFFVGDGNPDFYANVYIDYTLERIETTPVPEPSTMLLLSAGLFGVYGYCRRRK